MKIEYDPEVDIMDIYFQEGEYGYSEDAFSGVIVDYSKNEEILNIEILDASKRMPIEEVKKAKTKAKA